MGITTISWTATITKDGRVVQGFTFNPWIGCQRVSPGCDHCYAETMMDRRYGKVKWGIGEERKRTSSGYWKQPLRWNGQSRRDGINRRVFCASLADVFDNEVPGEWRADLWQLMRETPLLRWMILTKRIGNARKMLPPDWPLPNAGLMATIVTQQEWDRDWPKLKALPAPWRGVSIEPTLERIDMRGDVPDWVITGGESGPGFRPLDFGAVRSIRDQCTEAGIAYHHKQNGGVRGKDSGCLVDGVEHKEFPAALAA